MNNQILDYLDVKTYAFHADETLEKILVTSDDIGIHGIQLITTSHTYGDLSSHISTMSSFSLPEYHSGLIYQSVVYFTGYATITWVDAISKPFNSVSGLQIHHHYANCQGT